MAVHPQKLTRSCTRIEYEGKRLCEFEGVRRYEALLEKLQGEGWVVERQGSCTTKDAKTSKIFLPRTTRIGSDLFFIEERGTLGLYF